MKKILFIFGTRPEAIKMAPVIRAFRDCPDKFHVKVCNTAQHREMTDQVLRFFSIRPDFDLKLMKSNQTLFDLTGRLIMKTEKVLKEFRPDLVFVQGDTTTAFAGALAAFYSKIKVAHIEAGLRSYERFSPFPEEMNRLLTGKLADYHFAPTPLAAKNLAGEGIKNNVWITGNTVIDALFMGLSKIQSQNKAIYSRFFRFLDPEKKIILVTGHRRESFGKPFESVCHALKKIAQKHRDVQIVYPVHLNPNVRKPVYRILNKIQGIHLIPPVEYPHLIWLMKKSYLILTDSGGIQEEAPSLGKPVLVMRDVTERTEGIKAGTAILTGTDEKSVYRQADELITRQEKYEKMSKAVNPYGDGKASRRILSVISKLREKE